MKQSQCSKKIQNIMSRHTMVRAVCLFVFLCILVYSTKQIIGITSIGTRSTAQWNRAIQGENSLAITQTHAIAARNYLESGAGQGLWDKVFFLGDSITFGMQAKRSADEPVTATYTQQFVNALHIPQYTVNAVGGSCFCRNGVEWFYGRKEEFPDTADAVFIQGGFNDIFSSSIFKLGTISEEGTIAGDVEILFDYIDKKYTDADVFVIIPYNVDVENIDGINVNSDYFQKVLQAIREIALSHNYYVIDLAQSGFFDLRDKTCLDSFLSDTVYPNDTGYKVLGDMIAAEAVRLRLKSADGMEGYTNAE